MLTDTSTDTVLEEESAAQCAESQTAGEILASERLRQGLDEKEVADKLHITMHYVKALESNSYEKLPGAVFAKGYLKSYAHLLGLDDADLLAKYDEYNDRQKACSEKASRLQKARRQKDRNKPLVIASLAVFIAGFLGLWGVNNFISDPADDSEAVVGAGEATSSSATAAAAEPSAPVAVVAQAQITQPASSVNVLANAEPETQRSESLDSAAMPIEEDVAVVAERDSTELQSLAVEPVDGLQLAVSELSSSSQALEVNQAVAELQQPRVITIEAMGNDVLRISFSGESWVEVNDSESQEIYRDIREAGDVLEITGSAPFNILLGDAPFTQLTLNGDEIDLTSDIRIDNSARLTVGL